MPSLFVVRGTDQGSRFELRDELVTIGREADNVVQLHDHEISRHHAQLRAEGEHYRLIDLSSSNGSYVSGNRVSEQLLHSGDQIQLGTTVLLYTGKVAGQSDAELAERIELVGREREGSSRIIRTMSQEEGSRIFSSAELDAAQGPWLARARSNLQIMYRTALAVSQTLDIDQLLGRIMDLIFEWVEAQRGCVMLINSQTGRLEPKVRRDRRGALADSKITISQTILDYVMDRNEGVLTSDAREDTRWNPAASILQQGVHEAICVPMQGRYDVVGVIYIDTSTPPDRVISQGRGNKFHEDHLKLLIAIAHQAALAVEDTRYYSAMVQAERLAAIGQTIATISHHVKNILQGIRGGSYLIELGLTQHDENVIRKGWDIVERNQKKISNLVLDMLTFSKEREPELVPAQLNTVVAEVAELMQSRAGELEVELRLELDEQLPVCTFDPEGLHRAVLNVVTNALDACQHLPGAQVTLATEYQADPPRLRVRVRDNGPGIAPEDQEAIFSLFVSRKGSRGTGLGLPVTQKILAEHGGGIRLESQLGAGSTFLLELPAAVASQTVVSTLGGNTPIG